MMRATASLTLALAFAVSGCASQAALQPAAGSAAGAESPAAVSQQGVRVSALDRPVVGPGASKRRVTPLRVSLHNASQTSVRVRYADLALVVGEDIEYRALPIERFAGPAQSPDDRTPWTDLPPLEARGFTADGSQTAAPSGRTPLRPGPDEYSNYGPEAGSVVLPTSAMIRAAIPEGTLEPGGTVTGYLYFAPITESEARVVLRARFMPVPEADPASQVLLPVRAIPSR